MHFPSHRGENVRMCSNVQVCFDVCREREERARAKAESERRSREAAAQQQHDILKESKKAAEAVDDHFKKSVDYHFNKSLQQVQEKVHAVSILTHILLFHLMSGCWCSRF